MRRLFWRATYPFVIIANRLGLSYKWVNVAHSAWMTPQTGFDPLWHYRWFGDEIATMPERVNLCGIGYRVTVHEGLILFTCDDGMSKTQLPFRRDPYAKYPLLWYVDMQQTCPAGELAKAYEWVKAVYGGTHENKKFPV